MLQPVIFPFIERPFIDQTLSFLSHELKALLELVELYIIMCGHPGCYCCLASPYELDTITVQQINQSINTTETATTTATTDPKSR